MYLFYVLIIIIKHICLALHAHCQSKIPKDMLALLIVKETKPLIFTRKLQLEN